MEKQPPLETLPRGARVPAKWRDLSLGFKALYLHFASLQSGPVLAFTLRLDPNTEAQAKSAESSASFLHDRLWKEFRGEFGRVVDFWFVIEAAKTGGRGLHVHGELVLHLDHAEDARKALRRAGGEWPTVRQHQSHTEAAPDAGWIAYMLKDDVWTREIRRPNFEGAKALQALRGFTGRNYSTTRNLSSIACRLYEADRLEVMQTL